MNYFNEHTDPEQTINLDDGFAISLEYDEAGSEVTATTYYNCVLLHASNIVEPTNGRDFEDYDAINAAAHLAFIRASNDRHYYLNRIQEALAGGDPTLRATRTLANGATANVFTNCETAKHQLHVRYNGVLIGQAQDDSIDTLLQVAQDSADQWLEAARKDLAA